MTVLGAQKSVPVADIPGGRLRAPYPWTGCVPTCCWLDRFWFDVAACRGAWHAPGVDATLVLGQQGRLVIPADVRATLGLAPGDRLHLHVDGRRLVLERPADAARELRGLAAEVPRTRSLVDELLAERRLAAATE